MRKHRTITQEGFDQLLAWLHPDREQAGMKYEEIRHSLIKIFTWRGISEAEDLADETINRVAEKLPDLASNYTGAPALYFYGVAKNVLKQYQHDLHTKVPRTSILPLDDEPKMKIRHECLDECLHRLTEGNRELILSYYRRERQAKIDSRKELARQLGLATNALRVRIHRIRMTLLECVQTCLKRRLDAD